MKITSASRPVLAVSVRATSSRSTCLPGLPTIYKAPPGGAPVSVFQTIPVALGDTHANLTFDTSGTFNFNLIATGFNGVVGLNSAGTTTFTYPNPQPGLTLEGAKVAPLSYAPCPGCLFIAGPGAIYVVKPGTPSGTTPAFFATAPNSPEGIVFPQANPCTYNGNAYFVSAFDKSIPGHSISAGGAILGWTPAQLEKYIGTFLVPDEDSGIIYAYAGPNAVGAIPNRSVFSNVGFQLEGSTTVSCPVQTSTEGFMTGGGQMNQFQASHGFNLGCNTGSNHNNLEVNWASGNKFHLESISSVTCYLDPNLPAPNPPNAGFNTLVLSGTGKYNNQDGATIQIILTDAGEPGTSDQASMLVSIGGSIVLNIIFANLATSNQQAHK